MKEQLATLVENNARVYDILKVVARNTYRIESPDGKLHPNPAFVEDIEAAQARLKELQALSNEEKVERAEAYNKSVKEVLDEEVKLTDYEITKRNEAVDKTLQRLSQIDIYSLCEHYEIDDEKIECELEHILSEGLYEVSNLAISKLPGALEHKTPDEWYSDAIIGATAQVQQAIDSYQREVARCSLINSALDYLKEILESEEELI